MPADRFDWVAREEALLRVLTAYLSPLQAESAAEQWEAVLAARPELSEHRPPDREA